MFSGGPNQTTNKSWTPLVYFPPNQNGSSGALQGNQFYSVKCNECNFARRGFEQEEAAGNGGVFEFNWGHRQQRHHRKSLVQGLCRRPMRISLRYSVSGVRDGVDSGGWPRISFGASQLRQPPHRLADGVALAAGSLRDAFRTLGSEVPRIGSGVPPVSVSEGADGIFGQQIGRGSGR